MTVDLYNLEQDFDNDSAEALLNTSFDMLHTSYDVVAKSLYNFDLETPEGIERLLELLPILDPSIMNEVYQEVFPGYPVDTLAPRMTRIELRGYFMDYLNGEFQRDRHSSDTELTGEPRGSEVGEEEVPG